MQDQTFPALFYRDSPPASGNIRINQSMAFDDEGGAERGGEHRPAPYPVTAKVVEKVRQGARVGALSSFGRLALLALDAGWRTRLVVRAAAGEAAGAGEQGRVALGDREAVAVEDNVSDDHSPVAIRTTGVFRTHAR